MIYTNWSEADRIDPLTELERDEQAQERQDDFIHSQITLRDEWDE